jgi:hypothetical protein
VGFVRCAACGGPVGTESRAHGSTSARQLIPHYACLDNRRRGTAICANRVALRQDILDRAILKAITEALLPTVLERAVEKALAKLTYARAHHATRQSQADGNSTRSSESSIYSSTPSQMAYCPPTRSKPG